MDRVMTTNLTLTLSVRWNVCCDNDRSVTQTVTLFDYSFRVNLRTVLERDKNVECRNNLRYLPLIPI